MKSRFIGILVVLIVNFGVSIVILLHSLGIF